MKSPALTLPGAFDALQALHKVIEKGAVRGLEGGRATLRRDPGGAFLEQYV
jgi:hypothetical protein